MTPYITERNSIGIWQNKQLCHDTPPSFMTIEGRLRSVRTVINILHFLNQLIVSLNWWKFWKIIWQKWYIRNFRIWAIHFYTPVKIRAYYGIPLFVRPSTPRTITSLTCCRTIGLSDYSYGPKTNPFFQSLLAGSIITPIFKIAGSPQAK
jgi:hypothetical protein